MSEPPLSLEGLAAGVDLLDAVLVFHLADARLYAVWVRPESGLRAEDVVTTLRDFYRVGQFVAKRLGVPGLTLAGSSPAAPPSPVLTLELDHRTATLRKVRAHVVACVFDAAMPLGMARLIGDRVTAALEPELPLETATSDASPPRPAPAAASSSAEAVAKVAPEVATDAREIGGEPTDAPKARESGASTWDPPSRPAPPPTIASPRLSENDGDEGDAARRVRASSSAPGPATLTFGSSLPRRSRPPPAPTVAERLARLIAHLEAHAPEPHVVRLRVALRAGLTVAALEKPELLGPEAVVLVETAVQDILGIDRAELRRIA